MSEWKSLVQELCVRDVGLLIMLLRCSPNLFCTSALHAILVHEQCNTFRNNTKNTYETCLEDTIIIYGIPRSTLYFIIISSCTISRMLYLKPSIGFRAIIVNVYWSALENVRAILGGWGFTKPVWEYYHVKLHIGLYGLDLMGYIIIAKLSDLLKRKESVTE